MFGFHKLAPLLSRELTVVAPSLSARTLLCRSG